MRYLLLLTLLAQIGCAHGDRYVTRCDKFTQTCFTKFQPATPGYNEAENE